MKIALVSQGYSPETAGGGIASQTLAKANGLAEMGHNVWVISRSLMDERYERIDGNVMTIRIPGFEDRLPEMTDAVQWLSRSVDVAAEIDALNRSVGLDIIDFPEWGAEGYVWLLNRTEWNHVATVIHLHGPLVMLAHTINYPEPDSEFYRVGSHMEGTCIRMADAVYSSSRCSAEWIDKYYGKPSASIPTIHMGIDTSVFKPLDVPKNSYPTIVFVGKIVQNKGVEELIEAVGTLTAELPDLRLRLIGRGDERYINRLRKMASRSSSSSFLDFAGFVEMASLPEELNRAHVFAAPSYYEGGPGFVYLEAMACGLPVIGCSGSGVEEIICDCHNGFLADPGDVGSLVSALRSTLPCSISDCNCRSPSRMRSSIARHIFDDIEL